MSGAASRMPIFIRRLFSCLIKPGAMLSPRKSNIGFMLLVHLLWGVGLELALVWRGARRDLARSVTFALYACGWDLLTSPLGALLLVCSAGPRAGFLELRSAMRVPQPRHFPRSSSQESTGMLSYHAI